MIQLSLQLQAMTIQLKNPGGELCVYVCLYIAYDHIYVCVCIYIYYFLFIYLFIFEKWVFAESPQTTWNCEAWLSYITLNSVKTQFPDITLIFGDVQFGSNSLNNC